jgi:hypothetical protein
VTIDKIFTVLDALFQSRDQILGAAVFIEIFEPIDEVGMLREMQILAGLALFAHFAAAAVLEGADEGNHLLVAGAKAVLVHLAFITILSIESSIGHQFEITAFSISSLHSILPLDRSS